MRLPANRMRNKYQGGTKKRSSNSSGGGGWIRSVLETVLFIVWLIFTGIGGYFIGHTGQTPHPVQTCPPQPAPIVVTTQVDVPVVVPKCIPREPSVKVPPPSSSSSSSTSGTNGVGYALGAVDKDGGYTMDDIKHMWKCSHAVETPTSPQERMFPSDKNIEKTKWKSIVSLEPKYFFDRYLSQYPGNKLWMYHSFYSLHSKFTAIQVISPFPSLRLTIVLQGILVPSNR